MPQLIKTISLFFICFSLFITNCSENSSNSNPMGPGDQFTNPTKEDKTYNSNPYKGTYSGTYKFDDENSIKLKFYIDEDYNVTGSETWSLNGITGSFDLEGEVSEDGDIWMYAGKVENGIKYTSEYEGTIKSNGKVSGDVVYEIAGMSFDGTWSASKGSGNYEENKNETYTTVSAPSSIAGTTYRFYTGAVTYEVQFRANGYGTMYTSAGSFGIKYQYVKKSNNQASVRMWQYIGGQIYNDRYDDFSLIFDDSYSGKCTHTGESSIGKYGPISGTFERIQ